MWGYGIYKHDSFFKAPLFIGTDLAILALVLPLSAIAFVKARRQPSLENYIGYVLLRMILKVGKYLGIILPMQTFFQLLAGIDLPVPALITKVGIFVALAAFATYFERKIKKDTQYIAQLQV